MFGQRASSHTVLSDSPLTSRRTSWYSAGVASLIFNQSGRRSRPGVDVFDRAPMVTRVSLMEAPV